MYTLFIKNKGRVQKSFVSNSNISSPMRSDSKRNLFGLSRSQFMDDSGAEDHNRSDSHEPQFGGDTSFD